MVICKEGSQNDLDDPRDAGRSLGWKLVTTDAAGYFEVEGLAFGSHWALVDGHVVHFQAQQGRFARLEVR